MRLVVDSSQTSSFKTRHYIRFSTPSYEDLYAPLNVDSESLVNAVLEKAVLDTLNASEFNTADNTFTSSQQVVQCYLTIR